MKNVLFWTLLPVFICQFVTTSAQESTSPQIYGVIKTKFEVSSYDGTHRFSVRNSRFGVRGSVSPKMRYAVQIELNSLGKLEVLDSYAAYKINDFELSVGQQQYKFSTDLDRGAGKNYFANRSFLGKFITQYYYYTSNTSGGRQFHVSSIGSRDIGALLRYRNQTGIPFDISCGIFNGSGINNPQWTNRINFVSRIGIGRNKGFGGAMSYYHGDTPITETTVATEQNPNIPFDPLFRTVDCRQRIDMWGAEFRYIGSRLVVESEFAQRLLHTHIFSEQETHESQLMTAAVVSAIYRCPLPQSRFAEYLAPALRWDCGDNIQFANMSDGTLADSFSANRLTFGLNLGLAGEMLRAEIRLNFEHYFLDELPTDISVNQLLHDKITLEFFAAF